MRKLISEYLETLSDDEADEDEYFMTPHGFARWQLEKFEAWLDRRSLLSDRAKFAIGTGILCPTILAVVIVICELARVGDYQAALNGVKWATGILCGSSVIAAWAAWWMYGD